MLRITFSSWNVYKHLEATPTILALCSLRDQVANVGLLSFGDCDRQPMMALLNQRVSVAQSCFLWAQIAYHELQNIDCSTPGYLEENITRTARRELFNCSSLYCWWMKVFAVLTCNPSLFVYQSLGLVSENRLLLPIIHFFRIPTFFVSTVDKKPVTSCKFAMQAEEVCVYTSVKFDLCSIIICRCTCECPAIIDGGRI